VTYFTHPATIDLFAVAYDSNRVEPAWDAAHTIGIVCHERFRSLPGYSIPSSFHPCAIVNSILGNRQAPVAKRDCAPIGDYLIPGRYEKTNADCGRQ
jgi:hypothetical protein